MPTTSHRARRSLSVFLVELAFYRVASHPAGNLGAVNLNSLCITSWVILEADRTASKFHISHAVGTVELARSPLF